MKSHTIPKPFDAHVHLRRGRILRIVAPHSDAGFGRILVMPNTDPPILTGQDAMRYREEIRSVATSVEPLMTIKILPSTTPEVIRQARAMGVVAGKVYPEGVTTNSDDGAASIHALFPAFAAMEESGMVLSLHGESPRAFCLDREREFLAELREIAENFPRLKIVLEHVTTREAVDLVAALPDTVAATITVHHLMITLDDVIGGMLHPHLFCKPIAKRPEDRDALIRATLSGNPKFFLGTDSAPHPISRKECADGCAGIYTAPVAMPLLVELFDRMECLDALAGFASIAGARFYGVAPASDRVTFVQEPMIVPKSYDDVIPFRAGETISWRQST